MPWLRSASSCARGAVQSPAPHTDRRPPARRCALAGTHTHTRRARGRALPSWLPKPQHTGRRSPHPLAGPVRGQDRFTGTRGKWPWPPPDISAALCKRGHARVPDLDRPHLPEAPCFPWEPPRPGSPTQDWPREARVGSLRSVSTLPPSLRERCRLLSQTLNFTSSQLPRGPSGAPSNVPSVAPSLRPTPPVMPR